MKDVGCTVALLQRERCSPLSRSDEMRLEAHLSVCPSCRLDKRVFEDFDAEAGVQPGDELLDAVLVERILKRRSRGAWLRRRSIMAAWAAACLLLAVVAMGAELVWSQGPLRSVDSSRLARAQPLPSAPLLALPALLPEPPRVEATSEAPPSPSAPNPALPRLPRRGARRERPNLGPSDGEPGDAASLFEHANGERRRLHAAAAIALYSDLERRYPESHEAQVARVSMGQLLLDRGLAAAASAQFGAYLSADHDAALRPEALFGQARACEASGDVREARQVWSRLLNEFGDSVYASEARQRLSASP